MKFSQPASFNSADSGGTIGGGVIGGTPGSVLFVGPGGVLAQNNASFFWSNTASQLQIGTSNGFDNNPIIALSISGSQNSYFGTYERNSLNGANSSTDFIVGADNDGVALTGHFGDFGIQSSGWLAASNPTFNGMVANDIYLYGSGGNLIIGTDAGVAGKQVKFFTGGLTSANQRITITDTGTGFLSTVPTNTITLGSASTGYADYQTADQTTNYTRYTQGWSGTTYTIGGTFGGTGTAPVLRIGAGSSAGGAVSRTLTFNGGTLPFYQFIAGTANTSSGQGLLDIGGSSLTAAANTQIAVSITPVINQTVTAGFTGLYISPQTSGTGAGLGSGTSYLIDAGTSSSVSGGNHTSLFNVTSNGIGYFSTRLGVGSTALAPAGLLLISGANTTSANFSTTGFGFALAAQTFASINGSGTTVPVTGAATFGIPTFTETTATILTSAATVYIDGAPTAGSGITITSPFALFINSGNSFFGGALSINGSFIPNGAVRLHRTTVADVAYTSLVADNLIAYTSLTAPRAVTLTAPIALAQVTIKDEAGTAGTNNITITPVSGTIDGAANKVINANYGFLRIYYNGTNWFTN